MFCCTTCIIAFVFLVANFYTILSCSNTNKEEFYNVLTNNQKETYNRIIDEIKATPANTLDTVNNTDKFHLFGVSLGFTSS